jgi:MFS family permease
MSIERRMRGRVHYGWVVVAVTFVTLLAAAGIRSAPGVLMIPLEREFGWTRATVSFAVSINLFLYGLSGPFIAGLMDRLGIRRVMVTSLALVATGVALTSLMTASWQLALLWGVVVGLGTGTLASVLGAMVANRWFTERRAGPAHGQLRHRPAPVPAPHRLGGGALRLAKRRAAGGRRRPRRSAAGGLADA